MRIKRFSVPLLALAGLAMSGAVAWAQMTVDDKFSLRPPPPLDGTSPPPAPDYAKPDAWAARPGVASGADARPPGILATSAKNLTADVFFVHPTTYLSNATWNARYDESGRPELLLDSGVLRFQAAIFNGCCRIFAPRYRQASVAAFIHDSQDALAALSLAYSDVLRAFDHFIANDNKGRPFIIAAHSQGSLHAMRLLQERVFGTPLAKRLVVAYLPGAQIPADLVNAGSSSSLRVCEDAQDTGCVVSWNTVRPLHLLAPGSSGALLWLDGEYQRMGRREALCVNPLNWRIDGTAPASANIGAIPGVDPGQPIPAPIPAFTGARCGDGVLTVSVPGPFRKQFRGLLAFLGSYHVYDFNLFYMNIRQNAADRIAAFLGTRSKSLSRR